MSPRARPILLAALALGLLALGVVLLRPRDTLFPALDPAAALRIEMAQGRDQLVLARPGPTAEWSILSADDAPADAAKVAGLLQRLARLAPGDAGAAPAGAPLDLRVTGAGARVLAEGRLWPGAVATPGAPPRAAPGLHLPDLAPSGWSTLAPPALPAAAVVSAARVTPAGPAPLSPAATARLAGALAALAGDWQPARALNWAGAPYFQLRLADGALIEVQLAADARGRGFVRLNSPDRTDIARLRAFAFAAPALDPAVPPA